VILTIIAWWLVSSLVGLAALPLAWRAFGLLPDRGWSSVRALGLLAGGYLLWLGASTGVFRNDLGGTAGAVALTAAFCLVVARRQLGEIGRWVRSNLRTVVSMEGVFLLAFVAWAFIRANNPEITATEKPMELAYLNAILRSPSFPPHDPWLSGYAISYYYLGYVLLDFLTYLTGSAPAVAFNMANALWFALVATGCYGLLFNLLATGNRKQRLLASLLGPIFVLISGNLEGFLDSLHAMHLFWRSDATGNLTSGFWTWLGIQQLVDPPAGPPGLLPSRYLWWWRASRVVHDINLAGASVEVIDEFPFFSFLLADNHPHLLALPFVLLAITAALAVFMAAVGGEHRMSAWLQGLEGWKIIGVAAALGAAAGAIGGGLSAGAGAGSLALTAAAKGIILGGVGAGSLIALVMLILGALPSALGSWDFWFAAWLFGSLAFLNTWDFPIYLVLLLAVLIWVNRDRGFLPLLRLVGATAIGLVAAGVIFYLPWYPGFSSQAGGILPNLGFPTRLPQFVVMFGVSLVPIVSWLLLGVMQAGKPLDWPRVLKWALGIPLTLFIAMWLLGGIAWMADANVASEALSAMGASSAQSALGDVMLRWLTSGTALVLGVVLAIGLWRLWERQGMKRAQEPNPAVFVTLMVVIGSLLVMGPEFFYIKDLFGTRMNTIFKFYFAAWILWGIAAAYCLARLSELPGRARWLGMLAAVPLILGLWYPVLATWTKTNGFDPPLGRTLDGTAHLLVDDSEDAAAIEWINGHLQPGVMSEAVGGSYTLFGRISTHTGFPTVLGWEFHEVQWRGSAEPQGSRAADIQTLYQTRDPQTAGDIINRYGIDYVYIGALERSTYKPIDESKFRMLMTVVYQSQGVTIYALPGWEGE
jgi:uncharacterized membrane protein